MNTLARSVVAAVGIALSGSLAFSAPAQAQEHWRHEGRGKEVTPQEREAWVKKHIDREAALLEIKASQQSVWEAYAAAKLDLAKSFGAMMQPGQGSDLDAAAAAHRRADRAADIAQKLAKLADATEKLQAVLSEDQRKVLNRIVSHSGFRHPGFDRHWHHGGHMCDDMEHGPWHERQTPEMPKPAPKAPAAKSKQP